MPCGSGCRDRCPWKTIIDPVSDCQKSEFSESELQVSHRVPSSADDGIESNHEISGDMRLGNFPSQSANVGAQHLRCSTLHPFEKMLAFSRERVDFFDTLKPGAAAAAPGFSFILRLLPRRWAYPSPSTAGRLPPPARAPCPDRSRWRTPPPGQVSERLSPPGRRSRRYRSAPGAA